MPCSRQCVYILFLVPGKIYSFWRDCFTPARYVWSGHPNLEHTQNFPLAMCLNSPREMCFFLSILWMYSCCLLMSCWNVIALNDTVSLALILLVHTRVPICFVKGKKKNVSSIFRECIPNLNFILIHCSEVSDMLISITKKWIFSVSPIQEQICHFHNMQTTVSQLTSIRSKLCIANIEVNYEKWCT